MIQLIPENFFDSADYFCVFFHLNIYNPDLFSLKKILEKFATIPYENISKIIKLSHNWHSDQKLRLPDIVIDEHAKFHLGGTCFSLTFFLETILLRHNFICYPVMADMTAGENIHCAMVVIIDRQQYLVDPGYLLTEPMALNTEKSRLYRSSTGGVELRFNEASQEFNLFTFNQDQKKWRYKFKNQPCAKNDFLKHWQDSFTKPSMHGLCLTKVQKDGMIYIHKNFMRETTFNYKKNYHIKNNFIKTIHNIFSIDKNIIEQAQAALNENLAMERKLGIFVPRGKK